MHQAHHVAFSELLHCSLVASGVPARLELVQRYSRGGEDRPDGMSLHPQGCRQAPDLGCHLQRHLYTSKSVQCSSVDPGTIGSRNQERQHYFSTHKKLHICANGN